MAISQDFKREMYHKALELKKCLEDMRLVYLPLQQAMRKLGLVDEQRFRELVGEELQEMVDFNHQRANKITRKADKLVHEIIELLESEE